MGDVSSALFRARDGLFGSQPPPCKVLACICIAYIYICVDIPVDAGSESKLIPRRGASIPISSSSLATVVVGAKSWLFVLLVVILSVLTFSPYLLMSNYSLLLMSCYNFA